MENLSGLIVKSYRIDDQIDAGGFGAVYRAYQQVVERDVALKVILPRFANETEFIRRFEVEARTVARLEHPYIVPLYDFWRDPDGAYLVMRLMRGGSLRDVVNAGALPIDRVLLYLDQIASALGIAHRNDIIHRDIKPENILLDEDGNAYLTDFGIAQHNDIDTEDLDSLAGSVNYIAPELIRGQRPRHQSDIYSLGIMVYELLAGRLPFAADVAATMLMHHLNTLFPDIREVAPHLPESISLILQRACAKDPEDRYPTVADFARAFREVTGDLSSSALVATAEMYQVIENPYKGLRPFEESDASDFFGREQLVMQLIDRLNEDTASANFLAVVGPSGSGKSSVVRAGLIPKMRTGLVADTPDWFIADFVPGTDPIGNLASALLRIAPHPLPDLIEKLNTDHTTLVSAAQTILSGTPDGRICLFIDQFEEVFTLTENEALRVHLLSMITHAVKQDPDIYVITTIRADFFDRPLLYEGISDLIQARTQVVLPLSAQEIERAITGPAENAGLIVERELVAAIIADVRDEPGALPLLQYALTELFERRDANRMTLDAYIESGGVLSALARRAQDVYDDLLISQRNLSRQIFLRLVTLGEGTEDTRRRVRQAELFEVGHARDEVETVLGEFGKYRLLTFDRDPSTREPTVEIAHEALIRRWDDLRNWLDESRNDVRLERSLAVAAREWEASGRREGYLLFGARLLQYEEWIAEATVAITEQARAYLDASIAEKERREAEERERLEREKALQQRVLNRTRLLALFMSVAVVITIGLVLVAVNQSRVAQIERDNAQIARATSDANALNAETQLTIAEQRAAEIQNFNLVNIAEQSVQRGDSGLAVTLLQTVASSENLSPSIRGAVYDVAYDTQVRDQLSGHTRKVTAVAVSPDGAVIATGSEDLLIYLWDADSGDMIGELTGHRGPISGLAFSPDGSSLLSGANDGLAILWDVETQSPLRELRGHRNVITGVDFAPDGNTVATSSGDNNAIIWDPNSGEMLHTLEGHTDSVRAVAYAPDSMRVVTASRDRSLIVWDVASGDVIRTLSGHNESVQTVAFAPDGASIISGSFDRSLIRWSAETGEIVNRFIGHSDEVTGVAVSPDSQLVVSTSCAQRDTERTCIRGEVILWDINTGREMRELVGHSEMVNDGVFSPDGLHIITGSCASRREGACITGEALIWDVNLTDDTIYQFTGHGSSVFSVSINSDGTRVLSGGGSLLLGDQPQGDTSIILWDTTNGEMLNRFVGHTGNVSELLFHPNNQQFVSASRDGTVRIWSLSGTSAERIFAEHKTSVYDIEFNSDGQRVLSAGDDGVLYWDFETEEIYLTLNNFGSQISARTIAISPDDTIIATGLNNGIIILWDAETGAVHRRLTGHTDDVLTLDFSPDGRTLVSGASDRTIRRWNVETGQELRTYSGHLSAVTDVTHTPDGKSILSASDDTTLRLWDIEAGEVIRIFNQHTGEIFDASISTDGQVAYTASADGTVIGWRISLDAVMDWLNANRFSRLPTEAERDALRLDG